MKNTKRRLTWDEWTALGVEWKPRPLRGGSKPNICDDHGRPSVWLRTPDHRWLDTGLCATDLNRLERGFRLMAKANAK